MIEPIKFDKEYSAFNVGDFYTNLKIKLSLVDEAWMIYAIRASIPTKQYGNMRIEFEYYGTNTSFMKVWIEKPEKKKYGFEFDSKIFKEHIIKFMQRHIASWDEEYAFEGIEELIAFYNTVLISPSTPFDIYEDGVGLIAREIY